MPQKPIAPIRDLIGRRLPFSGLQNAHIIGVSFYNSDILIWLRSLLPNVNDDINFVVLPESERGSAILGVAAHFGNQNSAFDKFFFSEEQDKSAAEPSKFLNRLKRLKERDEPETQLRIDLLNFLDYVKVLFLFDELLGSAGYRLKPNPDPNSLLENVANSAPMSLAFNVSDPRFATRENIPEYYNINGRQPPPNIFAQLLDDDVVRTHPVYTAIEAARDGGVQINNRWLVNTFPELTRMLYPSADREDDTGDNGEIVWATGASRVAPNSISKLNAVFVELEAA